MPVRPEPTYNSVGVGQERSGKDALRQHPLEPSAFENSNTGRRTHIRCVAGNCQ